MEFHLVDEHIGRYGKSGLEHPLCELIDGFIISARFMRGTDF